MVIVQQDRQPNAHEVAEISNKLTKADREQGSNFAPKFDANGLACGVAQHHETGEVLMVAFLNEEAIDRTLESGLAHFYSRSRDALWQKGETSGNVLRVREIRVDCDQDALVLLVEPAGPACHTGEVGCFYRRLGTDKVLSTSRA